MITLLSYPRSGNHFVRFIIEFISSRPTRGCADSPSDTYIAKKPFENSQLLKHVKIKEKPIVAKSHFSPPHPQHPENTSKLIFIVRNFAECITNHLKGKIHIHGAGGLDYYMNLIKFYDNFTGPKIIIYYEDLIISPEHTAQKLYDFLEIDDETYLDKFKLNTKQIVEQSKKCKQKIPCYANKSKNKVIFHSEKLNKKDIETTVAYIKENFPSLYNTYLDRYI